MLETLLKELVKTAVKETISQLMSSDQIKATIANTVVNVGAADLGKASTSKGKKGEIKASGEVTATTGETSKEKVKQADKAEPETTGKQFESLADSTSSEEAKPTVDAATLRAESLAIIDILAPTHGRELRALLGTFGAKRLSEVAEADLPQLLNALEGMKDAK